MASNVGARHHHVIDALLAEFEHVAQDDALGSCEIGGFTGHFALEGDLEIVAQRHRAQGEQRPEAGP